jgi:hypothetical protein
VRGKPFEWASAPHPSPLPVKNGERERTEFAPLLVTFRQNALWRFFGAHSGLMSFSSMNLVQFLISLSSLARNAAGGANSGVMSRLASRSRTY